MDVKKYRKQYEDELAAAAGPDVTAPAAAAAAAENFDDTTRQELETLRNTQASLESRTAALRALRIAAFLAAKFAPYRADFINTLREILHQHAPRELIEGALEVLAAEKDPDAQEVLKRGLRDAQSALLSPVKALRLLGYDDHANIADLALDIFHRATDLPLKEAALRALATDPKSQGLFEQILQDKNQPFRLRSLSATGLNHLNPQKFADVARRIVGDHTDSEEIRASSLGALANAPASRAAQVGSDFHNLVRQLGADHSLGSLNAAARRMLTKL
jgi:hypothetical protein